MTKYASGEIPKQVSVVGIGNVLLGDDGFGPLVVEMFSCHYECGSNVEVLDLGTPGLDIAPYLYDRDLVILVDAVRTDGGTGTLCLYREEELTNHRAQLHLTGHDPGIQNSLAHLRLAGHAPAELIVVGLAPEGCEFGEGISPSVLTGAQAAIETIARLLKERGIQCQSRKISIQPNLWWLSQVAPLRPLIPTPST
jgi:hydrogenase maturation protease